MSGLINLSESFQVASVSNSSLLDMEDSLLEILTAPSLADRLDYNSYFFIPPFNPDETVDLKLSPLPDSEFFEPEPKMDTPKLNIRVTCNPVGKLTAEQRREKIIKYLYKKQRRRYNKKINYRCRKRVADNRTRVKGRFVTKEKAAELGISN